MTQINRLTAATAPEKPIQQEPELVGQVLAYIAAHYQEKLTLQQLADRFYVSKYHLSHTFSSQVGTSIYRYILLKRLLAARAMIQRGEPAGAACIACGFADYSSFFRAYRRQFGHGPKEDSGKT